MWKRADIPKKEGMFWESGLFCLLFLAVALGSFKDTFFGQEYSVTLLLFKIKQVMLLGYCNIFNSRIVF